MSDEKETMEKGRPSRGIAFGIVIVILMGVMLFYMLSAPTSLAGGLIESPTTTYTKQVNITLYADQEGWNFGIKGDTVNPTFNITLGTKVCFTVIEEDGAPHTLTIADSPHESSAQLTLIQTTQLTCTIGHSAKASYIFNKLGAWTYWCTIHSTTMVGTINVIAPVNSTAIVGMHSASHLSQEHKNSSNGELLSSFLSDIGAQIIGAIFA